MTSYVATARATAATAQEHLELIEEIVGEAQVLAVAYASFFRASDAGNDAGLIEWGGALLAVCEALGAFEDRLPHWRDMIDEAHERAALRAA